MRGAGSESLKHLTYNRDMNAPPSTCPLPRGRVVDLYFMEHRAKLLDIAAFLDRLERSAGEAMDDFRVAAFKDAIALLIDGKGERTRRILESFSDPTEKPLETAAGMKGASGTWPGAKHDL
jgi:hypothetical protein